MALLSLLLWGILALLAFIVVFVFLKLQKNAEYFRQQGIPYMGSVLGDIFKFITGFGGNIVDMEKQLYKKAVNTKFPMAGLSDFAGEKNVYVTDMEMIRSMFVKDFDHFVNRRPFGSDHEENLFTKMLISSTDANWKETRSKLSPCFTTGKIKKMFQIFTQSSERMDAYLKEQMGYPGVKSMDIDFMQIFSKYTIDVIASCAFGIGSKNFDVKLEEKSLFEKMSKRFGFQFTPKQFARIILVVAAPKIAEKMGVYIMDKEAEVYLAGVIKDVMKRRRQTGETRDDFLQLMMDVQQGLLKADDESNSIMNGSVAGDGESHTLKGGDAQGKMKFDDDHIIANGIQFLNAGSDTTLSALLFTIYSLAREPEVQEKLYEDVSKVMEKYGGKLTYDGVNEMKYLDLVVNESLRMYPPATRTERICTKDYPVPGTKAMIPTGTIILVPIMGIHYDPKHYPNPDKFDPERFTHENKASRHTYSYLPFGQGPRNCIGNRFALVKVKAALAQLVYSYQFAPCAKTMIPLEFDRQPIIKPKDSMFLNATVRNH